MLLLLPPQALRKLGVPVRVSPTIRIRMNSNLEGTALHRGNGVDTKRRRRRRRIRRLHLKSNDRFIVKEKK